MGRPRLILLVRHGESHGNRDKSVNCYTPNHKVPLTENGHQQAFESGLKLRDLLKDDESVCFYTSPYLRTRQTLQGIIKGLNDGVQESENEPENKKKVEYVVHEEPRMREQDFGNFQGTPDEMKEIWIERARYGHFFYRIPHGESAADVYDRCSSFNDTLFRQFKRDDFPEVLVLVTHGIWARVFLQRWFRWSVEYFEDLQNIPHCSWIQLELCSPENSEDFKNHDDYGCRNYHGQGELSYQLLTPLKRWDTDETKKNTDMLEYPY